MKRSRKSKKFRCPPLPDHLQRVICEEAKVACDEFMRCAAGDFLQDHDNNLNSNCHLSHLRSAQALSHAAHEEDDTFETICSPLQWKFIENVGDLRIEKAKIDSCHKRSSSALSLLSKTPGATSSSSSRTKSFRSFGRFHSRSRSNVDISTSSASSTASSAAAPSEANNSLHYYRGSTQLDATVDDIMELHRISRSSSQPNTQLERKLSPDLLHSVLLYTLKAYDTTLEMEGEDEMEEEPDQNQREEDDETTLFIGIRWTAMRSPYVLVSNRDFCYLEIHRHFRLRDGRRGFARCFHSVKIECCPDLEQTHGFVRGSLYRSGFVFVENTRDRRILDGIHAVYFDLRGLVPKMFGQVVTKNRLMHLVLLRKHLTMKKLAAQEYLRRSQLAARDKVSNCYVCVDDIGVLQRRFNCQKCGEVVCRKCKMTVKADLPVVGIMKLTICSLCALSINRSAYALDNNACSSARGRGSSSFAVGDDRDCDSFSSRMGRRALSLPFMKSSSAKSQSPPSERQKRNTALDLAAFDATEFDQSFRIPA